MDMWYDIYVNRNWDDTQWQYLATRRKTYPSTTLPITNSTQTNLCSNQCPAVTDRRLNS
jgi:hypothetical protein